HWATGRDDLPKQHIDVYQDYGRFLAGFGAWVMSRLEKEYDCSGLAINALRGANEVIGGFEVYTSSEVFYLAGIPVFITEQEFLSSPSRMARFCDAFWVFARHAHLELEKFLQSYFDGYIIAVDNQQRMKYSYWLHIYAKHQTFMSERMRELVSTYVDTLDSLGARQGQLFVWSPAVGLYDVFEPTYLRNTLERRENNLGGLVFGQELWSKLGDTAPDLEDPLSSVLCAKGISLTAETHLDLPIYEATLFVDKTKLQKASVLSRLYCGENSTKKQLWTIIPNYPENIGSRDGHTTK
ncbi:uncharacterized protein PHACADRAFT_109311, partial [Phanerochaete carnosa HHB-10118-sp]